MLLLATYSIHEPTKPRNPHQIVTSAHADLLAFPSILFLHDGLIMFAVRGATSFKIIRPFNNRAVAIKNKEKVLVPGIS